MDTGRLTGAVFLDLFKVFDTVDYHVLLQKLRELDLTDSSFYWFRSYLTNR